MKNTTSHYWKLPSEVLKNEKTNQGKVSLVKSKTQEYNINNIVKHVGRGRQRKYFVRWLGYNGREDTLEPPTTLPQHFINASWKRGRKSEKSKLAKHQLYVKAPHVQSTLITNRC